MSTARKQLPCCNAITYLKVSGLYLGLAPAVSDVTVVTTSIDLADKLHVFLPWTGIDLRIGVNFCSDSCCMHRHAVVATTTLACLKNRMKRKKGSRIP